MKILVFNGAYLPAQNYGGPVTGLANFVAQLGDRLEIAIVCRNHDLHQQTPFPGIREGFQTLGKAQVCYLPDSRMNRAEFARILQEQKPDCLYLSSVFDAHMNLPLLRLAKKLHIPVVYAPRGELSKAVLAMKALKKRLFLTFMRLSGLYRGVYFQATSEAERADILRELHVDAAHVICVPNLPCLQPKAEHLPKKAGALRVVSISRIHSSKNLAFAIARVQELRGDVTLDIFGPIEEEEYWQKCRALFQADERIRYCGQVPAGEAAQTFARYDCFLFPTLSENYSHAIAECLLSGTPPIISKGTTPWDDVQGGYAVSLDEPQGFTSALQTLCDMDEAAFSQVRGAVRAYAAQKMKMDELNARTMAMFARAVSGGMT
ncbi:MAG: glycosyltransferase [Oscillospiraceae bacterium]|jgi:glycosyltransferase involved in cell wall biosynthesis|nr:glycosyltransferase [Oscillospiraceae bacterium]